MQRDGVAPYGGQNTYPYMAYGAPSGFAPLTDGDDGDDEL
jgi:hypothetical protein